MAPLVPESQINSPLSKKILRPRFLPRCVVASLRREFPAMIGDGWIFTSENYLPMVRQEITDPQKNYAIFEVEKVLIR